MASSGDLEPAEPAQNRSFSLASRAGSRWRDKLKDKASRLTAKTPERGAASLDDVSTFLRPGSAQSSNSATSPPQPPPHGSTLTTQRSSPASPEDARPPPPPNRPPWKFRRKLPTGVHVNFTPQEPEVIGEGGDECELPSKDVKGSWAGPSLLASDADKPKPPPPSALQVGTGFERSVGPRPSAGALSPDQDVSPSRLSLARAPTRKPVGGWLHKRRSMNMEEGLVQAQTGDRPSNGPPSTGMFGGDFQASPDTSPSLDLGYAPYEGHFTSLNLQSPRDEEQRPSSSRSDGQSSLTGGFQPYNPAIPAAAPASAPKPGSSFTARIQEDELSPTREHPPLQAEDRAGKREEPPAKRDQLPQSSQEPPPGHEEPYGRKVDPYRRQDEVYGRYEESQGRQMPQERRDEPHRKREEPSLRRKEPPPRREPPLLETADRSSAYTSRSSEEFLRDPPLPAPSMPTTNLASSTSHHAPRPSFEHEAAPEGEEESEEFYARVQHLRGVFRLAAEKCDDIEAKALEHWLRAATWWFLRGRSMIEGSLRAAVRPLDAAKTPQQTAHNLQSFVNLAKAWWISEDVLPDLFDPRSPAVRRNARDSIDGLDFAQLFEVHQALTTAMRAFALLLTRKDFLPPPALLVQGADPAIWIDVNPLPRGLLSLAAGLDPRTLTRSAKNPFFPILVADSRRHFSYGRVFGEAEITGGPASDPHSPTDAPIVLPCIISIVRDRASPQAELTLTSQDGQLNTHVQSDARAGPTWRDVDWRIKEKRMRVRLSSDIAVTVRMWEPDFKMLWGIHDYIHRVKVEREPKDREALVFEHVLATFHYVPPAPGGPSAPASTFPVTPVKSCLVRVFARPDDPGAGHRLIAVTPPAVKTLSSLTRVYGRGAPVLYSNLRGDNNAPALLLASREENGKRSSVVLTFADIAERVELLGVLSSVGVGPDENAAGEVPLSQVSIAVAPATPTEHGSRELSIVNKAQWQNVRVIGPVVESGTGPKAFRQGVRACATCNYGTVTDVIALQPGELQMSLDIVNTTMIKLYRPAQNNLVVAFADNLTPKEENEPIQQALKAIATGPTARIYKFPSLQGKPSTSR